MCVIIASFLLYIGVIRIGAPLDYETMSHYKLLVEALDPTTGVIARVNVYINVTVSNLGGIKKAEGT